MEKNIVNEVREFVEGECKKSNANYGPAYKGHFVPMHKYAVLLAKRLGADVEIVEIATWLHDVGAVMYGRENHHITGAEIAEEKLTEFGYSKEKIEQVKSCILNHRGSIGIEGKSIESKVIIEADAISNFNNIGGMFEAAFVYEHKHQQDAIKSVLTKLKNKFNQLSSEAKEIVKPRYEAAIVLFGEKGKNEHTTIF